MKYVGLFMVLCGLLAITTFTCNMCRDTRKTIENQFKPSTLLKKYEEFKNISAAIDAKRADIEVYKSDLKAYKEPISKEERFYYEQKKSEMTGLIMIHNKLCENYNARMAKFNYRFTNAGDLPASNLTPLPREYKPYILTLN